MEAVLRAWLAPEVPAPLRQLAVRVLGRRRVLSADEAVAAAHAEESPIVVDAASALGHVAAAVDARELEDLLRHKDEAVVAAALGACFLRREAMGLRRAAELVGEKSGEYAQAAMFLALGGGPSALDLFRRDAVRGGGGPVLVEALGWYGSLEAGPFLLERIAAKDDTAVLAMQRLTAASVTDDDPMPEYEPPELPFRHPHQSPPLELQLSADAKVWNAWWKRYVPGADLRARFRWGNAWSVRDNLWEMDDALATPRQRRLAHLELVVRTGAELPFDPLDFVSRQQRRIAEWRDYLELRRARLTEGGYPTTLERR